MSVLWGTVSAFVSPLLMTIGFIIWDKVRVFQVDLCKEQGALKKEQSS